MQLAVVGAAEDLVGGAPLDRENQPDAFAEPRPEDRMRQIGSRFVEA